MDAAPEVKDGRTGSGISRRWVLVGPILFLYMYGYMVSYFVITEYTNNYWKNKKLTEANLVNNVTAADSKCDVNASDPVYVAESKGTSIASEYIVYYSLAQGVPAVASSLILGSYTDALGRRFLLGIGIIGTTVRLVLSMVIIYFEANLLYLIGACVIEGLTGQYTTALQACYAYISDVTSTHHRTYGMAFVVAHLALALTVSNYLAGFLIQTFSFLVAISSSAGILVVSFLVMIIFLPESYPPEKRLKSRSLTVMLKNSVSFFVENDAQNNRWKYQLLFAAYSLSEFGFIGRLGVETLFELAHPFCWSPSKIGVYASVRSIVIAVFGVGMVGVYRKFLSDMALTMLSTASYAAGFLLQAIASTDTIMYIGMKS